MSNNHVINTHAFYLFMIMVILVSVPYALIEPPQEKVTMAIVDWWWMKSYQMWPWLATRGFWISGDIVIISAILLPFHPLSYQVICLPVTTIATHTFIESIISSHVKSKNVRCNFAFIFSTIFRTIEKLTCNQSTSLQGICNYTSSIKAVFIVLLSDVVGMRNHLLCALAPIVHV